MKGLIESVINEVTTTTNIVFLPSGFRETRKIIQSLVRNKKDLKIEVLESPGERNVNFEGKINVSVPSLYWDKFANSILNINPNQVIENPLQLDLSHILREAKEDVFEKEFIEFEKIFKNIVKNKDFLDVITHRNLWVRFFGSVRGDVGGRKSVFTLGQFNRDFKNISKKARKIYRDDLGGLQQAISEIRKEGSLIIFEIFEKFEDIISIRILSKLGNEELIYEVFLDLSFNFNESISTTYEPFLEKFEDLSFVSVDGNSMSPVGGKFQLEHFKIIKDELDDAIDSEEEKEEDG